MKTKQKILAMVVALSQLMFLIPSTSATVPGEKKMLMVSAYYSPLPDQRFYMRGSYAADIRLNGRGTNGADGTEVYTGMLAAPKSYPFGTRIVIPGLGVGEVHDRGGAILARKNYDRIDVWMGHGEEGLSRALNWGMRLVEGEVYFKAHQVEPGLSFHHISPDLPKSTLNRLMGKTHVSTQTFTKPITKASPKTSVKELQEALRMFGYYHGAVNGEYDEPTTQAILAFQLAEGVIQTKDAVGSGYFGPATRQALKSKVENFNSKVAKERTRLTANLKELTVGMGKHAMGEDVYRLQQMLWELGYYNGELNGDYNAETIDAVFEFQTANGIVNSNFDKGAGYFGKKTHDALVAAVDQRVEKLKKYPVTMQSWVPAKIELPSLAKLNGAFELPQKSKLMFGSGIQATTSFTLNLAQHSMGSEVRMLQDRLIEAGHLSVGLNTGYFGTKTKSALVKFQLEKGIVLSVNEVGAGLVGPATRNVLNAL